MPPSSASSPHAALLLTNAQIRTFAPSQPRASALAVLGDRIVAIGPQEQVSAWKGPNTKVIDASGRLLLPGFNDAHVHFLSGGFQLSNVDLRDANSPDEMAARLRAFASKLPAGRWITGGDWDHERWPGAPLPTRETIDAATPDHPVFVSRLDGHMALANSRALALAGVTEFSKDPEGGSIVRDAAGKPAGVLKDAAMGLVSRHIPAPSFDEKLAAAQAATDHAASLGVTSVQDMSAAADLALYQVLAEQGRLKTRIYCMTPLAQWERLAAAGIRAGFGSPLLRSGGLKGFSDGSLGSSTALFFEAYADDPKNFGLPADEMFPPGAMLERIRSADAAGLQVMIHAIGEKANHLVLEMFETIASERGPRDRRFRIEHAQHLRRQDIPRFAKAQVIASMQPYHAADDGRWAEKRIGKERVKTTYAFRSLLSAGALLAFGSDWNVAPLDPLTGIQAAVTRQTLDGKHPQGWIPEEKISAEEAVRAYTIGSAMAERMESDKGSLEPGKLADFVLLSHDILSHPEQIAAAKVLLTVMGGKVVYESQSETP